MHSDRERAELLYEIERHTRFIERLVTELSELDDVKPQNLGNPHFEATRTSRQRRLDQEREVLIHSKAILMELETRALDS
jgi:hypothetical protein